MADRLKINGNFLVVFEDVTYLEYIRNVRSETTFKRLDQDNFSFFYREPNIANTDDLFTLGGDYTKYLFSDLINDVTGLAFTSGDDLDDFLSDKLAVEKVNVFLENLPTPSGGWSPPSIFLGSWIQNGVIPYLAAGAGHLFTFDANQDDETHGNLDLDNVGGSYNGENIELHIHWQLFTAPVGGDNVIFQLDYAFCKDGDDNYTKIDGTIELDIDVSARLQREQYTDVFPSISGDPTATTLQMTIRRNGQGAGSDSYSGDSDIYSIGLVKI